MATFPFSQAVVRLIRKWWDMDRVRVSSLEAELWKIQPGSLLTIRGEDMEVLSRTVHSRPVPEVVFECRGANCSTRLKIRSFPERPFLKLYWGSGDSQTELQATDVQIWK